MRIVWCSWKDRAHPQAGGAEVVTDHILQRLADDGHEVTLLTADYPGAGELSEKIRVIRGGGRFTSYFHAWRNYRKHLKGKADLVVDEMNTIPFFTHWYAGTKSFMMVHQLARQIWFYQMPWLLGWIGYIAEPVYLFLLRKRPVVTVSDSTKRDLMRYGFNGEKIHIISEGVEMERLEAPEKIQKYRHPTMLSLGAMRAMKRTIDQVKAFEIAKKRIPNLRLKIAGDSTGTYGQEVLSYIEQSPHKDDIEYLGRVSHEKRLELMRKSHVITVTSVKEGWGLIVSEAASQGTPAVVYDVDGLRDSVQHGETGFVARPIHPVGPASAIEELLVDASRYQAMCHSAWRSTERLTFDQCYKDFTKAMKELV